MRALTALSHSDRVTNVTYYKCNRRYLMEPLSPRQKDVLDFLRQHLENHGYPPTLREIARKINIIGTAGVVRYLEALEKKGWIKRQPGGSRSITLTSNALQNRYPQQAEHIIHSEEQFSVSLPIVGVVRAGSPEIPLENIEGYLSLDRTIAANGGTFFLRINGDSMKNAGMLQGDLVLIRSQSTADNGDVVVALVDGEATVKRFFRDKNGIRLQPENETLQPILIGPDTTDFAIIGKVVSLFRTSV